MIRRVILLGTGPRGGEGMTFTEPSADEVGDPVALLMGAFCTPSEASQGAGRAYIERLKLRTAGRDAPISKNAARAQLEAIREWGAIPSTDRYADAGQDPPARLGRAWEQGRRRHSDQRPHPGAAPA